MPRTALVRAPIRLNAFIVAAATMIDFEIRRTNRRCNGTGCELKPGDWFYSELVEQKQELVRLDYSDKAWHGPSENCIGWWKSRIPRVDGDRVYWAPRDVLLSYFESLLSNDTKSTSAYVMAILLIRKRILQIEEVHRDESGGEVMELSAGKQHSYRVPAVNPTEQQVSEIQQELAEHLFMDHPPDASD